MERRARDDGARRHLPGEARRAVLDRLVDAALPALERSGDAGPRTLMFLLRCYAATGRTDLQVALEPALARALADHTGARTALECAAWLGAFAEALPLSSDVRLRDAADALASSLRAEWGAAGAPPSGASLAGVIERAASIEACLRASGFLTIDGLVADAIDELERLVASTYRPGEDFLSGAAREPPPGPDETLAARLAAAGMLLTAYEITGRLPYPMLAEELIAQSLPSGWIDRAGAALRLVPGPGVFSLYCDACVILCRLAVLHQDDEYRRAAVVRPGAAYGADAARLLEALDPHAYGSSDRAAAYGLALLE